jgi:hypothetical protein
MDGYELMLFTTLPARLPAAPPHRRTRMPRLIERAVA